MLPLILKVIDMESGGNKGVGQIFASDLAGIENQHDLEPNATKDAENEYPSIKDSLSSLGRCFDYINSFSASKASNKST